MVVEAAADKMGNEAKGAVLAPANICGHSENPRNARRGGKGRGEAL